MRFVVLVIVLGFPLAGSLRDGARRALDRRAGLALARLGSLSRALCCCATSGWRFARDTVAAMHGEQSLLRGLFDSGRKVLAGIAAPPARHRQRRDGAGAARAAAQHRPRIRAACRRRPAIARGGSTSIDGEYPPPRLTRSVRLDRVPGVAAATSSGRAPSARLAGAPVRPAPSSPRRRRSSAATATVPSSGRARASRGSCRARARIRR